MKECLETSETDTQNQVSPSSHPVKFWLRKPLLMATVKKAKMNSALNYQPWLASYLQCTKLP